MGYKGSIWEYKKENGVWKLIQSTFLPEDLPGPYIDSFSDDFIWAQYLGPYSSYNAKIISKLLKESATYTITIYITKIDSSSGNPQPNSTIAKIVRSFNFSPNLIVLST